MTLIQIALAIALFTVTGLWLLARGLAPRPMPVAQVRARYFASQPGAQQPNTQRFTGAVAAFQRTRPGRWVHRELGPDMALLDLSWTDVGSRVLLNVIVGLVTGIAAPAVLIASGVAPGSVLWAVIPIVAVAGGATVVWTDIRTKAQAARREFRQAANDFVQLVAVCLTTHRSIEESTRFAATAGDGTAFDRIRSGLDTAPQRGLTVWEALAELGDHYQLPELTDLAGSVGRQAQVGVGVTETVEALAGQMRSKALDDLERAANRTDANLFGPTILFVFGMVLFLAYPLAARITTVFNP